MSHGFVFLTLEKTVRIKEGRAVWFQDYREGEKKQTKPQRARTTPQLGTVSMDPYLTNKNRNNTGVKGNVLRNRGRRIRN